MTPKTTGAPALAPLRAWHRRFDEDGAERWRLTRNGIETKSGGIERTKGKPATVASIWARYKSHILTASARTGVPVELIIATIATESRGDAEALRKEPGYKSDNATPHRVSPGLMQTLISTARSTLGDKSIGRAWLMRPGNSILAGASYIAQQAGSTKLDPPCVAAAYNAGAVYLQKGEANRWKMRQYPIGTGHHCDRFVLWFNDAMAVLREQRDAPANSFTAWLGVTQPDVAVPDPMPEPVPTPVPGPGLDYGQWAQKGLLGLIAGAITALFIWIFGG